jgi:hypothetical protein
MPPTLILTPRYTADSRAMRAAAIAAGWDVFRLGGWRVPEEFAGRELAFYGEPLLAEVIAETVPYALLEPSLDWLPALPVEYANRAVRLLPLGAARTTGGPAFFKPAGDKCFPAGVYPSGAGLPLAGELPDETPVLWAEPVAWALEMRCFVLERQVATLSPYLRHGALAEAEDGSWPATDDELAAANAFAARVLGDARVGVPPAVTLDVGIIAGRGWSVVEANAAWGSGLYGCDPAAVLPVLRRATMRRADLTDEDRAWVLMRE